MKASYSIHLVGIQSSNTEEQRLKVRYRLLILQGADESRMDIFDDVTLSVLEAASVDEEALKGLSRDDLRDLFPGPEHFFRRKKLWDFISQNRQGSVPQRGVAKTALFSADNQDMETDWTDTSNSSDNTILLESNDDISEDNSSAASPLQLPSSVPRKPKSGTKTLLLPPESASGSSPRTVIALPTTPAKDVVVGQDNLKMQARHYRTLSNMYNKPNAKPNHNDVAQLLDLEFEARRAFIDADVTREEDRPAKIFEAYPCFKDVRNAAAHSRWHQQQILEEVKGRWADFCAKVQFYGVWKKALKPLFSFGCPWSRKTLACTWRSVLSPPQFCFLMDHPPTTIGCG
ncbi:hypothetical protein PFLUV_G00277590 [Perca fluviatilis]|uniref:Uncharacterized protein n=1 Tax=Perca fluviatilis TaxID=8168 RepID=A0A6A5E0F6_PERFL|nr:hypothetical protein PFLUV_G00277590 [Perca fluviatilis]